MGVKGFPKGHIVSEETRAKISKANDGNFFAKCDCCGKEYHTKNHIMKEEKDIFAPKSAISILSKKSCHLMSKILIRVLENRAKANKYITEIIVKITLKPFHT